MSTDEPQSLRHRTQTGGDSNKHANQPSGDNVQVDGPGTPPARGAHQQPPQNPVLSFFSTIYTIFARVMVVFWFVQIFGRLTGMTTKTTAQSDNVDPSKLAPTPGVSNCVWPLGTQFQMYFCVSEDQYSCDFDDPNQLVATHEMTLGDWSEESYFSKFIDYKISENVQNNGTLYSHLFVARNGALPGDMSRRRNDIFYLRHQLNQYRPRQKKKKIKSLLGSDGSAYGEDVGSDDSIEDGQLVSYWYRNVTVNLLTDSFQLPLQQIKGVPRLLSHLQFTDSSRQRHFPVAFFNDFWALKEDVLSFPINSSVSSLPIQLEIAPYSWWKFQMTIQMSESFKIQQESMGISDTEIDQLKRMFTETNPWLLGITFVVSLLHSLFDFLAFKNDVQFWKERKNAEGLSMRSIALQIVMQAIIFLYLLDNDTSWLILVSSAVGLAIEVWKLQKVVIIGLKPEPWLFGIVPYRLDLKDRNPKSKLAQETDNYDRLAFKYLGMLAFPLVAGYSVYSLVYEEHKGWYSWMVNTAVGFVYTFGFIAMTPQLFINYKLKSVAHMPWKTFMYKALNTFIDDLFAFIIKMPTLHRLACFRDDLVFLVYLYQKWTYPVDHRRPNEYGQISDEGQDESKQEEETKKDQ